MEIRGRDLITGLPKTVTVYSSEMLEALTECAEQIVEAVHSILEKTPPELSADIINKGIVLTGGGALINGLDELLQKELDVPVYIAESPLTCVAEGTGVLLNNLYLIEK